MRALRRRPISRVTETVNDEAQHGRDAARERGRVAEPRRVVPAEGRGLVSDGVRWSVRVDGDDADLADLATLMNAPELDISEVDGVFALRSTGFDHLTSSGDVLEAARPSLGAISGIARIHMPLIRPITAIAVVDQRGSIATVNQLLTVDAIISRGRVFAPTISGGEDTDPTSPNSLGAELALDDSHVARALELFGLETTWVTLYQVLDVIEEDVGGGRALEKRGWAPVAELKRFTGSANSFRALGPAARHARVSWAAPANPMTLREAKDLLGSLLKTWLEQKLSDRQAGGQSALESP